ncbi:MAG: DegT/DnrJ/EryC1/StrS family aminotransferase [Candidatus Omnitrophica bacterium]|nr:DegT/DnrJ/EryC1/StrS family aminotransferase [Candidatus Omnitrophota bacterium]
MKLAIHGGKPVRKKIFPGNKTIATQEIRAVKMVLTSGVLSKYLGCWHDNFYGGKEVQALEKEWARYFKVKHAVAVNSATSGLMAAVGAAGIGPGDEVITSPYTMSATPVSVLVYGGVPVFADIEDDYYCLDVKSVEKRITKRTKAIMAVDIFGQPYDVDGINALARKHGLYVIEDCAQAPGATYAGKYAGTMSDMGVFSLNYHKHIHCGEGGMIVTNDDKLAQRLQLIRNHAETVVEDMGVTDLNNMLGFNFRMTELQAAVARCQLRKLNGLLKKRLENVSYLEKRLKAIPAVKIPKVRPGCKHAFYVYPMTFDASIAGVNREVFLHAVKAELSGFELRENEGGAAIGIGYVRPLYFQPLYQKRILYGGTSYPFDRASKEALASYEPGSAPVCERKHFEELFTHEFVHPFLTHKDLDDVATAFFKVWDHREELQ